MSWKAALFKEGSNLRDDKPSTPQRSPDTVAEDSNTTASRTSYLGDSSTRSRARSAVVGSSEITATTAADPQFDIQIKEALDRATTPGYHELVAQMDVLQDVIPDEGKRMQKALESVGRMLKITPEQITTSFRERIGLLESEQSQFESGLSAEISEHIEENSKSARELDSSISQNEADQQRLERQIQDLKSERSRMADERTKIQSQIQAIKTQADSVRARFKSAYNSHMSALKSVLNKIQ